VSDVVLYFNAATRTAWFSTLHPCHRKGAEVKTTPENIKRMEEAVTNLVDAYRDLIDIEDCEIQSDSYITDQGMTIKLRVKK
jgi:hypothetical protein